MNAAFPKVSVIIPTYNRAHVIRRALHSVLRQTYENLEVIVVDDASTDNTVDVVASIHDERIVFLQQKNRRGAAVARNIGIQAATGDFVAFQDSDDEWLSEKIEKQMAMMLSANVSIGLVYTGFLRFENKTATYFPSKNVKMKSGRILGSLLIGNFVTTQSVVVRKDCLTQVGLFDEQLPRLQDWELFIRLAGLYEFTCIDEPLLIVFHTPQSITSDNTLFPIALKILLEKHEKQFLSYPIVLAKHYLMLSLLTFKTAYFVNAVRYLLRSMRASCTVVPPVKR
jgi:glycosyltransferase involved in cell wall biosynthesis